MHRKTRSIPNLCGQLTIYFFGHLRTTHLLGGIWNSFTTSVICFTLFSRFQASDMRDIKMCFLRCYEKYMLLIVTSRLLLLFFIIENLHVKNTNQNRCFFLRADFVCYRYLLNAEDAVVNIRIKCWTWSPALEVREVPTTAKIKIMWIK